MIGPWVKLIFHLTIRPDTDSGEKSHAHMHTHTHTVKSDSEDGSASFSLKCQVSKGDDDAGVSVTNLLFSIIFFKSVSKQIRRSVKAYSSCSHCSPGLWPADHRSAAKFKLGTESMPDSWASTTSCSWTHCTLAHLLNQTSSSLTSYQAGICTAVAEKYTVFTWM